MLNRSMAILVIASLKSENQEKLVKTILYKTQMRSQRGSQGLILSHDPQNSSVLQMFLFWNDPINFNEYMEEFYSSTEDIKKVLGESIITGDERRYEILEDL